MTEQISLFDALPPTPPAQPQVAAPAPTLPVVNARTPLDEVVKEWCEQMGLEGKSLHTIKAFGSDLRLFAAEAKLGGTAIGQIGTTELNDWLQVQRTVKKVSPKSYARRVTSLKSFFRWLTAAHVLAADPALPIIQHSVISPLPAVLSRAAADNAVQAAQRLWQETGDPTPYTLFGLLLTTGIKKGECLELMPGDVDLDAPMGPVLLVRAPESNRYTARYKERRLALDTGAWLTAYQAYLPFREAYLAERKQRKGEGADLALHDKLFPWSPRRLEYLLEDIGKAAGIEERLSFDLCRWTCAVLAVFDGVEENAIRQKLGLSKIQWHEIGMKLRKLTKPGL